VRVAEAEELARVADLPLEATVPLAEVAGAIKDGRLAFAAATGLVVMHQMMQAELTEAIGEKHAKIGAAERTGNWHGTTKGSVVLGEGQVNTERPRGRSRSGAEIELDTWKVFSSADLLNSLVVERMLAGVATHRHVDVAEPLGPDWTPDPSRCPGQPCRDASWRPPRRPCQSSWPGAWPISTWRSS
jgi:hypothetical protein